ncbi:hypothetical protein ABT115_29905 [Streptomyces sp. NPDC001832]|uniref:hypothetical protein n=1 Tax=Streptomyces sp. NPDC001832 TaxID=3154527 RepID=UPI003318F5DC
MIPRRIALVGPVASGKSTLAAAIAAHTGLPHLDLDELFWGPSWAPVDPSVFRDSVRGALAADTWIADGNYGGETGETLLAHAELAIWLDLPLRICLPRLIRRSLQRAATGQELFAGNRETFSHLIARDSILWWGPAHHHRHRRRWAERFHSDQTASLPVVHLDRPAAVVSRLRSFGLLASKVA